jgi:hypothetical protein
MTRYFALLSILFTTQAFSEQISANFAINIGPITHAGSGVLHSISPTAPNDSMLSPIKPSLFRAFPWATHYDRAAANNAAYQMVVSDLYKGATTWPGDNNDWTEWETTCRTIAQTALAQGQVIQFDLWNEPDQPFFFGRSKAQFLETWKHGVNAIRSVDPTATIVGPSTSTYWWFTNLGVKDFLTYAKANNVLPDIISWHAWNHNFDDDIRDLQQFGQQNGIDVSRLSINEYLPPEEAYSAGAIPYYLNTLETYRAESSAKSCWDTCFDNSLDGLVGVNNSPRSIWWVYERYGKMNGNIVSTISDGTLDVVASQDTGIAYALVGRSGSASDASTIVLQNLNTVPSLVHNNKVHVVAELIDNTETGISSGPTTILNADYTLTGGDLLLPLQGLGTYDAYAITVTAINNYLPGDFNDDGRVDAADYVMLRKEQCEFELPVWRGNFNQSPLIAQAVVPEPNTKAVALWAILIVIFYIVLKRKEDQNNQKR